MKLIAFTHNNKRQIGAVDDEYVIPVDEQGPDNLVEYFTADDATKPRLEDRISSANHHS